jgi:hypothetical protein
MASQHAGIPRVEPGDSLSERPVQFLRGDYDSGRALRGGFFQRPQFVREVIG